MRARHVATSATPLRAPGRRACRCRSRCRRRRPRSPPRHSRRAARAARAPRPAVPASATSAARSAAAKPTGWPRSPAIARLHRLHRAGQRLAPRACKVAACTSGRSPGRISQPAASAVARTAAAIESPMPGWPASSRCHGRPLARTAASVCSSTGLPASSACSLEPLPPDAQEALAAARGEHDHGGRGAEQCIARSIARFACATMRP